MQDIKAHEGTATETSRAGTHLLHKCPESHLQEIGEGDLERLANAAGLPMRRCFTTSFTQKRAA